MEEKKKVDWLSMYTQIAFNTFGQPMKVPSKPLFMSKENYDYYRREGFLDENGYFTDKKMDGEK